MKTMMKTRTITMMKKRTITMMKTMMKMRTMAVTMAMNQRVPSMALPLVRYTSTMHRILKTGMLNHTVDDPPYPYA